MVESGKYKYVSLIDIKEPNKEYDFYGLVIDATYPAPEEYPSNYVSILKIIDPTSNFLEGIQEKDVYTVIVKASDAQGMPYVHVVGDIVRIHRGYFRPKGANSIYCNMTKTNKIKSSWCLFHAFEDEFDKPYGSSSISFTFEKADGQKIKELRSFAQSHFQKKGSLKYKYVVRLEDRVAQQSDFDLLVRVKDIRSDKDKVIMLVEDKTESCELHVDKYYDFIEQEDLLRVRHVSNFNEKTILLSHVSNILKVEPNFSIAKQFFSEMKGKAKGKNSISLPIQGYSTKHIVAEKEVVTETTNGNLPLREFSALQARDKKVNMFLKVIGVALDDLRDAVKFYNRKTGKIEDLNKKKKLPEDGKLIYSLTVLCEESPFSQEIVKLFVSTHDNEGQSFFNNVSPCNFYDSANVENFRQFSAFVSKLKGKFIKASVEVSSQTDERIFRLVGTYTSKAK